MIASAFANPKITQAGSESAVTTAFGENGAWRNSPYAVGMIIPSDFESGLVSGTLPQITLLFNGSTVNAQTKALLTSAIINYTRARADPQPPATVATIVINPPKTTNAGVELSQVYASLALLLSLTIGTTFIPLLLIEEKEKKTLRMLMITPASFMDILLGKLLVVLAYQLVLTAVVLAILGGFSGQVALVILYALLGACFSLALGLLFGVVFDSLSAVGGVEGVVIIVYVVAGVFVGPLGQLLGNGPVLQIIKLIPTYYIAEGAYNASARLGLWGSNLLDIGVILGCTAVLIVVSAWVLRYKTAVSAVI